MTAILLSEFLTGLKVHTTRYRHFEDLQADLPHLMLPLIVVLAEESGVRTRIEALRNAFKLADLNDPVRFLLIGHGQRSQVRLSSDYAGMLDIVRPHAISAQPGSDGRAGRGPARGFRLRLMMPSLRPWTISIVRRI
jgi:hypothetical protein